MDDLKIKSRFTLVANLSKNANAGLNTHNTTITKDADFNFGTASTSEANLYYAATRTLAASASEDLDLSGLLTDPFGDVIAPAEIVAIYVSAASTNTNNVVIGNATSNGFVGPMGATGTYAVKPGEYVPFLSPTGWAVTAGTGDLLKIANNGAGTGVTYTIVIVGRTVAA